MPTNDDARSTNGNGACGSGTNSSRASSRSGSTPGTQSTADSWPSSAAASRPSAPAPVHQAGPTELILDFSAPGRDTRRPLTRRGHVKSRLGCLSCKRRRVKCDERHPTCGQCNRLKLSCSYLPDARRQQSDEPPKQEDEEQRSLQRSSSPQTPASGRTVLPSVGTAMNLDHLAFYHQFLTVAYPAIPVKEQSAWADCAAMSHHYEYLAHAVLALGASHLTVNTTADWSSQALHHRTTALKLINERLDKPIESTAEGDALMGALICLCGQSSLLPDSVHEYVTMSRGSYLLSQAVVIPMNGSIFRSITDSRHVDMLASMFEEQPKDNALIEEFQEWTGDLVKICKHDHELQYQALLYRTISLLANAPLDALRTFTASFVLPALFDSASFSDFSREDNHTAHLLMANMFLLDYLLGHTCFPKTETPKCGGRKDVLIAWVHKVVRCLPESYRDLGDFPLKFCGTLADYDSRYLFFP